MKLKRLLPLLLCAALLCAFIVPTGADAAEYSMANFNPYTVGYTNGQFYDVNESAWYGAQNQGVIATACGLGLMNGTGSGFSPDGSLTIAQAVTMAARLCSIYNGDNYNFVQGSPWYQCYVDYAEAHRILYEGEFADAMNRSATRAEMAYLFYYALPDDELSQINTITSLPDVDSDSEYGDQILYLYNAGVLTGNDEYGTFTPNVPINRAAAAAIVSRMALPELRKEFTPVSSAAPVNPASLLDYSHYNVTKPSIIRSYNDFVAAWEWMLVNSDFEETFSSTIPYSSDAAINYYFEAAMEAYQYVATFEYFDYASFRRSINVGAAADGYNMPATFTLRLENADGISNSTIKSQIGVFEDTCADIVTTLYASGELEPTMTNREKAYVLYRYVVINNKYDQSYRYYTAYDAAVRGTSVCQGYAGMYSYLCNLAGVPMRGMTGMVDGTSHAWNRIYENGQWYYIDPTFADPVPDRPYECDDSWFWLTESQIRGGSDPHTIDADLIQYAGTFSVGTEAAA